MPCYCYTRSLSLDNAVCECVARIALAYGLACARVYPCLFVLSILSHKQVSLYKDIYNEPPRPPPRSPCRRRASFGRPFVTNPSRCQRNMFVFINACSFHGSINFTSSKFLLHTLWAAAIVVVHLYDKNGRGGVLRNSWSLLHRYPIPTIFTLSNKAL